MLRLLFGIFVIIHGIIHAAIWLPATSSKSIFDAKHSWLLDRISVSGGLVHTLAVVFAVLAALTLIVGGVGWLTHQNWCTTPLLIGAIVSLLLMAVYFNPWMIAAILLNIAVIYLIAIYHWPVVQ